MAVAKALESGQCGLTSLYLGCEADSARARSVSFCFVGAPCAMVDAVGGGVEAWMVAVSDASSLLSLLLLLLLLLLLMLLLLLLVLLLCCCYCCCCCCCCWLGV